MGGTSHHLISGTRSKNDPAVLEQQSAEIKNATAAIETDSEHGTITIETQGPTVKCKAEHGGLRITVEPDTFQ